MFSIVGDIYYWGKLIKNQRCERMSSVLLFWPVPVHALDKTLRSQLCRSSVPFGQVSSSFLHFIQSQRTAAFPVQDVEAPSIS
jgi:hypothetical protein